MRFLKALDQNGVPYQVQTDYTKVLYLSPFGGVITIIMYSLILAYVTYNIIQWQTGQMISKITTEYQSSLVSKDASIDIRIEIHSYLNDTFEQDPQKQYFMIEVDKQSANIPLQSNAYYTTVNFTDSNTLAATNQVFVNLYRCDSSLLELGQCASDSEVQDLLTTQGLYLSLYFNLSIINPNTFQKQQIKKVFWMGLDQIFCKVATLELIASEFHTNDGTPFSSETVQVEFTDLHYYLETQTQDYCKKSLLWEDNSPISVLGQYFFSMDYISSKTLIQYPTFFYVAANIGAISQIILLLRFFALYYNKREQEYLVLDTLANALYPELRLVNEEKSFRKLKSVVLDNNQVKVDSYLKFKKDLYVFLRKEITFHNIIINQFKFNHYMQYPNQQFLGYKISMDNQHITEKIIELQENPVEFKSSIKDSIAMLPARVSSQNQFSQIFDSDRRSAPDSIFKKNKQKQQVFFQERELRLQTSINNLGLLDDAIIVEQIPQESPGQLVKD